MFFDPPGYIVEYWEMGTSFVAQLVKNLPAVQILVQFLGQENPLEKE